MRKKAISDRPQKQQAKEKIKLTRAEKKQIAALMRQAKGDGKKHTAQQTIPYETMYPDGICKLRDNLFSKSIEFSDINYQLAQPDDKTATFEALCDFYNSLDSSVGLQLTFVNRVAGQGDFSKSIAIPPQQDGFDDVREVYRDYLADPDPAKMPILEDLYNALKKQPEAEAARVAAALELYVHGSLNVFNHRTNIDIHNRLVCFDIKELGKQLKKLGMLIIQDQVWGRVTENRELHANTWFYCDEFHLLLKEEQTAAYSVEIWKRFRKWGGIPTGITQNVKDLLASREIENIFENSDFIYMLNQAGGDRQILAKQLGISNKQLSYVTHSEAGQGIIFYSNVILPFVDRFPTDTELYRIMTTRPEELANG